ncbi:hypothetical protein LJC17_04935 [Acholeplasma sp. OttesenSCG-928-E16]|nr:hypothetical protein [Acholeplasma sp. OttesenSCG-928-E16]
MKLENLLTKLRSKNESSIRKESKEAVNNQKTTASLFKRSFSNENEEKTLKIIGITGSRGKSSIAFMLNEYLKKEGYKTVLFSSIKIDSALSLRAKDEAIENPLKDERMLLEALEDAIFQKADYLILEVNERAIKLGLTKDIPFDIRVITNIASKHNDILYSDYVDIKKQFFKEVEDKETTLIFSANDKEMFDSLYHINDNKKVTYMSNYVSRVKGIDFNKVNYLLKSKDTLASMNGLSFSVQAENNEYDIKSNLIMPYQAINILGVIAILDTLKVFDYDSFKEFIKYIEIPGRDEIIKAEKRTIIISTNLMPHLEILKSYQKNGEINKIILVSGATGLGHSTWDKEFSDEKYIIDKENAIKVAYNYIKDKADFVYITTSDTGATNKEELLEYQASFLGNETEHKLVIDRKEAIYQALFNSNENDCVFISGRGNRRMMCDSKDNFVLHLDKEEVQKSLKRLGMRN